MVYLVQQIGIVERFPELSLFYRLSSPLDSEMICIFPYFCPWEESAREIREILFKHCSLFYQEVLRNPVLLFLLSERKYSLWYWHRNVLTVPVHLSELPHSRAGCWCRCAVTGGSENLQILPAFLTLTCIRYRVEWSKELWIVAERMGESL